MLKVVGGVNIFVPREPPTLVVGTLGLIHMIYTAEERRQWSVRV